MQQQDVWGICQPPSLPVEMFPVIILICCSKIAFLLEEIIEEKQHWQKQEAQAISAQYRFSTEASGVWFRKSPQRRIRTTSHFMLLKHPGNLLSKQIWHLSDSFFLFFQKDAL